MNWDLSIKLTDLAIILATFCGPIFAVRTQRKLDDAKALRAGRERVFNMLMSTRATWLAPGCIEALNSIPIAFYGKGEEPIAGLAAWCRAIDRPVCIRGDGLRLANTRRAD
ncbi:DUF6680 family protein [Burkholderia sp. BCC0405]|uniref:DUF6680 family protein n=1 Tax=Burkholderia sp. BCC0405 TaxID=2676298 RepID=UPI00158B9555|nr:DUF6680 family protein [Burkholderia sp. BCC0405]